MKSILNLILLSAMIGLTFADIKIGYIDSNEIMSNFEEVRQIQVDLEKEQRRLEGELNELITRLDSLNQDFDRQRLLMSENRRSEKENEISEDGKKSWVEVECLGACVNAPMIQINDDYFEDLDPNKLEKIIEMINQSKTPEPGSYRGRKSSKPENFRKTLLENKNA